MKLLLKSSNHPITKSRWQSGQVTKSFAGYDKKKEALGPLF
jgi:hypothetical protein